MMPPISKTQANSTSTATTAADSIVSNKAAQTTTSAPVAARVDQMERVVGTSMKSASLGDVAQTLNAHSLAEARFFIDAAKRYGHLAGGFVPALDRNGEPTVFDERGQRVILGVSVNRQLAQLAYHLPSTPSLLTDAVALCDRFFNAFVSSNPGGDSFVFETARFAADGSFASRGFQNGDSVLTAHYQGQYGFGGALALLKALRSLKASGSSELDTLEKTRPSYIRDLEQQLKRLALDWSNHFVRVDGEVTWLVTNDGTHRPVMPPGVDVAQYVPPDKVAEVDATRMLSNDAIQYNSRLVAHLAESFGGSWNEVYDRHIAVLATMIDPSSGALRENVVRLANGDLVDVPAAQNASYKPRVLVGLAHGVQTYRELLQHAEQRLYADDSIGLATFADDIAKRLTAFLSNFQAVDIGTGLLANTVDLTARTHVAWPADSWASEVFIETLLRLGAAGVDLQKHRLADGRNLYDVMQQALKGRDAIYGFRYDGHAFYGTEARMLVNGKPFDWGRPEGHFLTPEEYASATIVRNPDGMTPVPFVNRTNHHAELAEAAAKAAAVNTKRGRSKSGRARRATA